LFFIFRFNFTAPRSDRMGRWEVRMMEHLGVGFGKKLRDGGEIKGGSLNIYRQHIRIAKRLS
jgi:hypothetical protein